jgi:lipid-A-disaccharide synthase
VANNKIFISAGDLSGEIHAANLVREIKKINPQCRVYCAGGNNLKSVSDVFIEDIVNINAFGFLPVKQIFFLKKLLGKLENLFLTEKPDKIILTDYYGFHIFTAKLAKRLDIPVYYYISPQVWASRSGRIKKLAETVKKMFVILPFEEELYKSRGVDAVFVGNPLIDTVPEKQNFEISAPPLIGLFPGSRKSVIKRHLPVILETAEILKEKLNADFIMFGINKDLRAKLPDYIRLETSNDFSVRKSIDIAVCPSGTVSLENALMGIPMAVMYKLSYFNYFLARLIVKVKYIAIVNILAGKEVVPEFIQFDAVAEKIAACVTEQLKPERYASKARELADFRKMLGTPGVSRRTAEMILND